MYLELVITFTGHEIDAYEEIWFDNKIIAFDGSGNATTVAVCRIREDRIQAWRCRRSCVPEPDHVAAVAVDLCNHKQEGCAAIHLQLKYDSTVFSGGIPNIRAKIRGAKVYGSTRAGECSGVEQ
jgi:hypothetical protein